MATRFTVASALALLVVAAFDVAASDEPITVPGTREQLSASIGPGYSHVSKIRGPVRSVSSEQLGIPSLLRPGAAIAVVGPLEDAQVRLILERVGTGVADATKVTGDQAFSIVQLGDPQHDPCCTTKVLFENRNGSWTNVGVITQSH